MGVTLNNIDFQVESENTELAKTILRAFINCALEMEPNEIRVPIPQSLELEITTLRDFIKSMKWDEEWKVTDFIKQSSEQYFYIHYDDTEAERRHRQFIEFATKYGLCR